MFASARAFGRDLAVQRDVIGAIMMRELVTRWGRRNLGFAWLFCEPLVFAFPVIAVWSYVRSPFEHGLPMTSFVWTGYMPLLIFRHVTGGALMSLRNSAAVLYHRRVTPLDLFIGRQGMEALGNLASVVVSFFILFAIGVMEWPVDPFLMMIGFLYTTWWALCIALILVSLSERYEVVVHIWMPVSYLYIFFSGFFILADWLPPNLREIAMLIDPPLHCYEIVRAGLFGDRIFHPHYDMKNLTFLLSILTVIGLWFLHNVREHIELE